MPLGGSVEAVMADDPKANYARIKQIFVAALERAPEERARFVEDACDDDAELRKAVVALLARHDEESVGSVGEERVSSGANEPAPFEAGREFAGRYRIVAELGHGGMGEVYRADDLTLRVPVALKLLRAEKPEHLERMLDEVRLARQVTHPAVCRVFDVGEAEGRHFFTMEYVDGEDLASQLRRVGRLPAAKVLELARELCAGLGAAHECGVLHRDLKPANMMLDARGHVKIVDFGIAIREGADETLPMGTPAYMAPEQLAAGGRVTEQTDLYALGLVLYELVTGQRVFEAGSLEQLRELHRNLRPVPPSRLVPEIDPRLEQLILQTLQENPAERPRSASAMAEALEIRLRRRLRWQRAAAVAAILTGVALVYLLAAPPSLEAPVLPTPEATSAPAPRTAIAVLPFANLGEREHEILVDGFTEEIINALSKVSELRVAARTSAFAFKDRAEDVRTIGARLGVGTVLEGSVRTAGDRLRITAQLVDAGSGYQLWSGSFNRRLGDLFAVQDEIARAIAEELRGRLAEEASTPLIRPPSRSLRAYQLYLQGQEAWQLKGRSSLEESVSFFEQALEIDPDYALAYAGLADAQRNLWSQWSSQPRDAPRLEQAEEAARRSLELDPTSAHAHFATAAVAMDRHRDWAAAERGFRRALELNPGWALGHYGYGVFLMKRGRLGEAQQNLGRALELDPLSPLINRQNGRAAYYAGDHDRAIELLERAWKLNPRDPGTPRLLWNVYREKGMDDHAREAYLGAFPPGLRELLRIVGRTLGPRFAMRAMVGVAHLRPQLSPDGPWTVALALAYLGDEDRMYSWLEKAAERDLMYVALEPVFDPYRDDPRFRDLLVRAGWN